MRCAGRAPHRSRTPQRCTPARANAQPLRRVHTCNCYTCTRAAVKPHTYTRAAVTHTACRRATVTCARAQPLHHTCAPITPSHARTQPLHHTRARAQPLHHIRSRAQPSHTPCTRVTVTRARALPLHHTPHFRGLSCKAHSLVYHSTLGWRVIKKRKRLEGSEVVVEAFRRDPAQTST